MNDWTFRSSAWDSPQCSLGPCFFRTLPSPGDIAPLNTPPNWSFHVELPRQWGPPEVVLLTDGYRLWFPQQPQAGSLTCLLIQPGVMVGQSTLSVIPALFSAEFEIQKDGDTEQISLPHQRIRLHQQPTTTGLRFCLSIEHENYNIPRSNVLRWMEEDIHSRFDASISRRATFWTQCPAATTFHQHLSYSLENLASHLRPPTPIFPFRWSDAGTEDEMAIHANQTLALALAWKSIDCTVAEELVCSALSCQNESGDIPARIFFDGTVLETAPAWPLFAQSAVAVWSEHHNSEFLQYVLPRLHRYLTALISRIDPTTCGIPCWTSAEESLIPEMFDKELASPDLTTLLLCEIEAFFQLCDGAPEFTLDRVSFQTEHDRLSTHLMGTLWDEKSETFRSRYRDGRPIERTSLASIMPLLWNDLPQRYENALLGQLNDQALFHTKCGAPLWLKWEDEIEEPPIPAAHQVFLVEALRRIGARKELQLFALTLSERLANSFRQHDALPDDLRDISTPEDSLQPRKKTRDNIASALAILLADTTEEPSASPSLTSKKWRWLDHHRVAVIGGAILALILVVGTMTIALICRKTLPAPSAEALAGLAHQQYTDGDYDQAISTYEKLKKGTAGAPRVELLLGNTFFARGDFQAAEKCYQNVLQKDPKSPMALYNLGIVLFRQNRLQEAAACYETLVRMYESQNPVLAQRARIILHLIKEQTGNPS